MWLLHCCCGGYCCLWLSAHVLINKSALPYVMMALLLEGQESLGVASVMGVFLGGLWQVFWLFTGSQSATHHALMLSMQWLS